MGNKDADQLAKEEAKKTASKEIELLVSDTKKMFKKDSWQNTQSIIIEEARHKGEFYFKNFYSKKKKPWFHNKYAETYFITLINRLKANYYNLNASLVRKNYIESPRCKCGYERENIDHAI